MGQRLQIAAFGCAAITTTAVWFGYRWVFLAAAVSAATMWIWRGALDATIGRPDEDTVDIVRPQGVRIVHTDGSETPCELSYNGVIDDMHEWSACTEVKPGDFILCETLPWATRLVVPAADDVEAIETADGYPVFRMRGQQ